MKVSADITIVGSGFAGSLLAMIARRVGRSVILLEKGEHPRFAIGESSTPLANLLLEELARRYDLPRLAPLSKWGTWQSTYPNIGCGLKRGFTFYHHQAGERFEPREDRSNQLLVAASPNDRIADTQWFRQDVDQFFMNEAVAAGAIYIDQTSIEAVDRDDTSCLLRGSRLGKSISINTEWIFDASGPNDRMRKLLGVIPAPPELLARTQALYTHFTGVKDAEPSLGINGDAVRPYPPDYAALHHVFEGGWVWSLRFNNGITSAGVMASRALADSLRLADGAPAWERLLARFPSLREVFGSAKPVRPFVYAPSITFRSAPITGAGYALLPSAAGFVDPLLSTGFPLALLGIDRLARLLQQDWKTDRWRSGLDRYASDTNVELDATALLIAALYRSMNDFGRFTALTKLYFAAASFSEMARRLGKPGLASGFLLHNHPTFGPAFRDCCRPDLSTLDLTENVRAAIAPIDIAGLNRDDRGNWYPVEAADTIASANKLQATSEQVRAVLRQCGI